MSRVKVKKQSVIDEDDHKELTHLFNQMTGAELPDPSIVGPKHTGLVGHVSTIQSVTEVFAGVIKHHGAYAADFVPDFTAFMERLTAFISANTFDDGKFDPAIWASVKNSDMVRELLVICANLLEIRVALDGTWETADKGFMDRCAAPTFTPFPFTKMNFKYLWDTGVADAAGIKLCELIFSFLQTVYRSCHQIYKIISSPDIDVSMISEVIINALSSLRKQVPRCEKAFKKIEESVSLLETNFDDYYKDYFQSNDPNNIFINFVTDVSNTCDQDAQLIFQCRKIVNFFRQSAQKRIAAGEISPEQKSIFDKLIKHYGAVDRKAETMMPKGAADAGENADDAESGEPATTTPAANPNTDERDIDDLVSQIENPRTMAIGAGKKRR